MNVNGVQSTSAYASAVEVRTAKQELDQSDFIKLLVAQIQNQDPLNPMDNTEMIAQMAQFSMLTQIESLNQSLLSVQALQMIGKDIYAEVTSGSGVLAISGKVDKVTVRDGKCMLSVGGYDVSLDDVREVYNA